MSGKTNPSPGFQPFIPDNATLREFTLLPLCVGIALGIIFGASSLYLVLKVGITVSASIPVAVISITLFRMLRRVGVREATILENNIVQTTGSAGESIAFGLGVTMPAIMILGFDLELARITLVAVLGGLLGILMMIPLRRALIVQNHGILKYPEGTACAAVLKASASDESLQAAGMKGSGAGVGNTSAKTIFAGFGIGLVYKTAMTAFKAWKEAPEKVFGAPFRGGSVSAEISPELLGVGYIIGPRIAGITCAGGVLAFLVLIPAIKFFGEGLEQVVAPGGKLIRDMSHMEIRGAYVLYIGAGAVAAGGLISLVKSLPTIWHGMKHGLSDVRNARGGVATRRTEQDLPLKVVGIGVLLLLGLIVGSPSLHMNILGALLIVAFGFLFVTVSSRLTGEIGSTSNPISGMTVATLLLTCLIFLVLGWTQPAYYVTALSVGGIVCIASSNGGTTSQDLKTGFLVGATPRLQQIGILMGAAASALVLGPILITLNNAGTVAAGPTMYEAVKGGAKLAPEVIGGGKPVEAGWGIPAGGPFRRVTVGAGGGGSGVPAGDYLVDAGGVVQFKANRIFPDDLRTDPARLTQRERLPEGQQWGDTREYLVWHKTDEVGGGPGRYLVDDAGRAVYLIDPGINGRVLARADGTSASKFEAPKATLMSYIIKGILDQKLPWALVLLGVMIAVFLEMAGIPSLAFAVGVYLPLSTSAPLFIGGLVRWAVDRHVRRKHAGKELTEEEMVAETDKSSGVMLASGYIAGGALAGIVIAFMAAVLTGFNHQVEVWSTQNNPFYEGAWANVLALIPFCGLVVFLYMAGRDLVFRGKAGR